MVVTSSPSRVIQQLLIALNLASDPGPWSNPPGNPWPVLDNGEPDYPDNCITVYDTDGISEGETMVDMALQQHHGYQIRIRSVDKPTGRMKTDAIRTALAQVWNVTVTADAHEYLVFSCANISTIHRIGTDAPSTKRWLFTLNAVSAIDQLN